MPTYCLELRSTANWNTDIRYRQYTTSEKTVRFFKTFPKINFTDSGHGIVPSVSLVSGSKRKPNIRSLWEEVEAHYLKCAKEAEGAQKKAARGAYRQELKDALVEIERLKGEIAMLTNKFSAGV